MSFRIQQGLFKYDIKDYYAILGVPLDADEQLIRKQYLKIARKLHPDTCKFKTEVERNLANQIFSQLVSLANKQLSSETVRVEYLLVLMQTGQKIAKDGQALTITSETSKRLYQATGKKLNLEYHQIITTISENQYDNIQEAINKIAEISEVNLVYIMQKQGENVAWKPKTQEEPGIVNSTTPTAADSTTVAYLKRAEEYLEINLPAQAMTELRDILKMNSNDSAAHALMGLAYLKQNQITMAKVHINKAIQSNAQEPMAIKAKIALDKATREKLKNDQSQASSKSTNKGIFKNLFGGKKS